MEDSLLDFLCRIRCPRRCRCRPQVLRLPSLKYPISRPPCHQLRLPVAVQCAQMTGQDQQLSVDKFLVCTHGAIALDKDSATLVSCAEQANGSTANLASCAGRGIIGSRLSPEQLKAVNCAAENADDADGFAGCIANGLVADRLNRQQRALLNCGLNNDVQSSAFAGCAARAMLGDRLSPEANAAIECAVQSQGDYQQFGGCAANKFLHLNLNPEQQIAVRCVISERGAALCEQLGVQRRASPLVS